ncbi:mannose-1-phosphate guanylyltransferase [Pelagibacteraceae bacterium]|nr:mannose-1-phosphate guanylyltransferase [Pelagibacteraceae bacterium]
MKIRPVILCGGSGTRLWPQSKENLPKQFIDFGGWNLFKKALERISDPVFDNPIISTNLKYLKHIKKNLKESSIKKYIIILEPAKRNTAPAILSSTLINEVPNDQPLMFLAADHLIENNSFFIKHIKQNKIYLNNENIFIFGIKPNTPSSEYGYFITKKLSKNLNKVTKFIEKPSVSKAKSIIKKKGYWNSGMFLIRKDSIINNYKKYQPLIYKNCLESVIKSKRKKNIYILNKKFYTKTNNKSFDYAILEKIKKINAIKLNIPWSDLGSWKEICKMYNMNRKKIY